MYTHTIHMLYTQDTRTMWRQYVSAPNSTHPSVGSKYHYGGKGGLKGAVEVGETLDIEPICKG